ncbi:hypothetical protein GGS23DRAFT_620336 [Durotheca rogersii]|uniref:uncharacterized protein n=1 Tax=Durotheca rogersii TaxID=419775 RepID=UPI00221EB277|nr:uncharacterized protein GGS23DRAFT_620336 [Durotheca rogersii]KAI5853646.1 hypothetical protein GGS23DRAFT_620336 [Durotheca rogersii]
MATSVFEKDRDPGFQGRPTSSERYEGSCKSALPLLRWDFAVDFTVKGHRDSLDAVVRFCDSNPAFQFPDTPGLTLPIHLDDTGKMEQGLKLHHIVLRMILVEQSRWYKTFAFVHASRLNSKDSIVASFGPDRGVPPWLMRNLGPRLVQVSDLDQAVPRLCDSALDPSAASSHQGQREGLDNDIAIVGMACQVAGASDLEEF